MTHLPLFTMLTSMASNCHSMLCSLPQCLSPVLITLIVCATLYLICRLICSYVKKYKLEALGKKQEYEVNKTGKENERITLQKDMAKEKEKSGYRDRLLNFLEKRAITPEETCDGADEKATKRQFDEDASREYIDKLEEFIKNVEEQQGQRKPNPEKPS